MIVLKQVIKYSNSLAVEATWVDRIVIPSVGIEGEDGYVAERIEETPIRCQVYSGAQLDELEADLGEDAPTYAFLISEVRDAYIPPPPELAPILPVNPRQIRMALTRAGIRATVEAAIAASDQDTKDWYNESQLFHRDNPLVISMGHALGQTDEQLDALWKLAITL